MNAKTQLSTLIFASLLLMGGAALAADETKTDPAAQKEGAQTQQPAQSGTDATQPAAGGDSATQLKSLDTDKDGAVSKAEADKMQGLSESFDTADKNKNGKLDANELSAAMSQMKK